MSFDECLDLCSSSKTDEASTSECMSDCEKMTEKTCIASCDDEQLKCLRDCDRDCHMDAMALPDTPHTACVEAHDECMDACSSN